MAKKKIIQPTISVDEVKQKIADLDDLIQNITGKSKAKPKPKPVENKGIKKPVILTRKIAKNE